jgi:ssDNA-binding Zn-finger/Zn-ribbon topoisomerase 1
MACQGSARVLPSTKIMPATKECPLCGSTMKLRENKTTVHVPGNPNATTRTTREWVCPDCDYFEEAEEAEIGR